LDNFFAVLLLCLAIYLLGLLEGAQVDPFLNELIKRLKRMRIRKQGPSKDERGRKPWYEDIKDRFVFLSGRFNTLDEREVLLQKEVAKLGEKVDWLIKLREERERTRTRQGIRDRFIAGLIVGLIISLIQIAIEVWRMTH